MADKIATWRYVADLGVSVLGEDPNRCPTYSELAALPGVAVSGTYAPNRLVKEADVKKGFVIKRAFTNICARYVNEQKPAIKEEIGRYGLLLIFQ